MDLGAGALEHLQGVAEARSGFHAHLDRRELEPIFLPLSVKVFAIE